MKISFSKQLKTFSLETSSLRIPRWAIGLEIDGEAVAAKSFRLRGYTETPQSIEATLAHGDITWTVCFAWSSPSPAPKPVGTTGIELRIDTCITNTGTRPVALGRATILDGPKLSFGDRGSSIHVLSLPGELTPRRVYRISDGECPRESKIKTQFAAMDGTVKPVGALQVGFDTFRRCNTVVRHEVTDGGRLGSVVATCDLAGWELAPGASTGTERFHLSAGADPYAQLEAWADRAAVANSSRTWEDAPIGWLGWAWVDPFTVERYEEVVDRNIAAISRRLGGFGLGYVWVSIGNIAGGTPGRWTEWNYDRFPGGPDRLRRSLERHGLKPGFWCGAYWVCALAAKELERLERAGALLVDGTGKPIVMRSEWQFGEAGELPKEKRPAIYGIDPSHPAAQEFLTEAFDTWRKWGIRYYMIDFLEAGAGNISRFPYATHHDKRLVAGPEVYHAGLETIRAAAGDDTYMLTSSGPSVHNAGFADGIRTGNDFGEGRALYRDSYFYPATFVINGTGFWTGPRHALQNQASAWYTHRKLYINDSGNVLTVDKPIPLTDARIHATIHAMSGGPSMIGDDLDRIDEGRLSLIKATLPRPREVARPVDLFASPHPEYPKVFHRRIDRSWGRFDVVAVYNFGTEPLSRTITFEELGIEPESDQAVFEFWNLRYHGTHREAFTAVVPGGEVRVFRFAAAGNPMVLGTDMHILMGEMELTACRWDATTLTLSGCADRPAGETGNLYLHVPKSMRVADPEGLWIAKDAGDSSLIVCVRLRFGGTPVDWSVRFARLDSSVDTTHDGA